MGRGTICCVPGCDKNTAINREVSWHSFPRDETIKRDWVRRINRLGLNGRFSLWTPTKSHKICGIHFNKCGRKKYEEKVPIFFPNRRTLDTGDGSKRRFRPTSKETQGLGGEQIDGEMEVSLDVPDTVVEIVDIIDTPLLPIIKLDTSKMPGSRPSSDSQTRKSKRSSADCSVQTADAIGLDAHLQQVLIEPSFRPTSDDLPDHTYCIAGLPDKEIKKLQETVDILAAENDSLKKKAQTLEQELGKERLKVKSLICKTVQLKTEIHNLESRIKNNPTFCVENVSKSSTLLKFYTGLQNVETFNRFALFVEPGYASARKQSRTRDPEGISGRPQVLSYKNQLLLVLSRLRLGLLESDLAFRFDISTATVSNIFSFWVDFLSNYLVQVPIWPSRNVVDKFMPEPFKEMYPSTRIILDCTEIFIENPTDFRVQSDTYSHYKSHNTAKGLIGITPNGFISFVSNLAPGRISDRDITNSSGLINLLEEGDSVMADRGFLIADLLQQKKVELNIPPFLNGKPQLSSEEEVTTREIARLRIHVERVISCIKNFRMLKTVFPNSMHNKLNNIWKICCLINNFTGEPLVDRTANANTEEC